MRKTSRRWGLNTTLYAANPWAVIQGSVRDQVKSPNNQLAAISFANQAQEYFAAASSAVTFETRPLLYYYSFLNLGKAIGIARGRKGLIGKATHGLASVDSAGHTPGTARIAFQRSAQNGQHVTIVDELHWALEQKPVITGEVPIAQILPQSIVGHRLWRESLSPVRRERFVPLTEIELLDDRVARQIWCRMYIRRDKLRLIGGGIKKVLQEGGLENTFRAVKHPDGAKDREFHVLELIDPVTYGQRPSDSVMTLVKKMRTHLWETTTTTPPFRSFYLYLAPTGDGRLPQWLSVYATFFWLGSLTRYQPRAFLDALEGPYGPFFREFLDTQPAQLLYFFASQLKRQDVTRPAIV